MYGQWRANQDQADAEAANAAFLREQAAFFAEAGRREELLQDRESKRLFGNQVSAYAAAGVDIGSGSALAVLAESRANAVEETAAIQKETDLRVRLALLRAQQADSTAKNLRSFKNNALQLGGTALGGAANIISMSQSSAQKKTAPGGDVGTAATNRSAGMGKRGLGNAVSEYE